MGEGRMWNPCSQSYQDAAAACSIYILLVVFVSLLHRAFVCVCIYVEADRVDIIWMYARACIVGATRCQYVRIGVYVYVYVYARMLSIALRVVCIFMIGNGVGNMPRELTCGS